MAGERAQSNPGDGNDCDVAVATLTAGAPAGSSTTPVRVIPISSDPVTRLPVVRHVTPAYNRYSIVNRCFLVHSASAQAPLSYAGPFRMQASSLGQYLLYGPGHDFLGVRHGRAPAMFPAPSSGTVWRVDGDSGRGFTITDTAAGTSVPVTLAPVPTSACDNYPEGQLDATGPTFSGSAPEGTVSGTVDAHTHVTAFELLGGDFHCGRSWHPFGIPSALPDCAGVQQGVNGQVESFLDYGTPGHAHDTRGWPTFRAWPSPTDLAEEGDYYTGIKRAWMAGLRVMVTHLVDNEALSALGTDLINRMIQQHFIVEVDHMDVKTGNNALSLLEAHHYSGVVSAHDWDDPGENTRIYNLGGFVTPIAGASPQSFVAQWHSSLKIRATPASTTALASATAPT